MANILEFLRVLLTSEEEQQRFAANPHQYLTVHEFAHLSGEDVAEAIPVLMQSLPPDITDVLAPYDDPDGVEITPVRPLVGESDVDAAIRQLTFATCLVTGQSVEELKAAALEAQLDEPDAAEVFDFEEAVAEVEDEGAGEVEADFEPERRSEDEADPFAAFGEEMNEVVRFAQQQMQEAARRIETQCQDRVYAAERQAEAIRTQAEEEANSLRSAATEEAESTRRAAQSDAENLRMTAGQEADDILQRAKNDAKAVLHEIRELERQLVKRLQGVESVFGALDEDDRDAD